MGPRKQYDPLPTNQLLYQIPREDSRMKRTEILVVEDESIVAMDIQRRLRKLGYVVPVLTNSGEEAIRLASERRPDLILMDIRLKGKLDGVETAQKLQVGLDIPTIYLTAYADEATLQRAKITTPYGYILKPFEDRELHTAIEMALHKHKLEKELKESRKWLETTLTSIGDAVIATDHNGRIKFMNPVAEELTGWQQDKALGRELAEIYNILDEVDRTPGENPVIQILQNKQNIGLTAHLLVAKDGNEVPIDDIAAPIKDDTGSIIGVVLTFRDISEERATQRRIQRQDQLAAVGQLAGGIAHEFNNILTSIIGFAELAGSRLNDPALLRRDLGYITDQGQRAAHLVRQIMDFSRKSILHKRPLDLVPFLEETITVLKHTLAENIQLVLKIEPGCEMFKLEADPAQIQQALTNLVANAQEAMPAGGTILIRLSPLSPRADTKPAVLNFNREITANNSLEWIRVSISDTGVGIKPKNYTRIFEPFYTTKEVGQGSGLGLAQVYGIIKQHGGDIDVESQVGQGTTFNLYLPVQTATEKIAPSPAGEKRSPARGKGETLLLVEDELAVIEMAQSTLEYLGYRVLAASDKREALEIYDRQTEEIALILVDLVVPEVGGISLAEDLEQRSSGAKLIGLTEYLPEPAVKASYPQNIVDWLQKPWNLEQLAETVRQALN